MSRFGAFPSGSNRQLTPADLDAAFDSLPQKDAQGFLAPNTPTAVAPTGNPTVSTVAQMACTFTTTLGDSTREFMQCYGMISQTGASSQGGAGADGKVLQYMGTEVRPGAGTSWVSNWLLSVQPGVTSSAVIGEWDMNNFAQHYGGAHGVAGIYPSLAGQSGANPPALIGLFMTGAGTYRNTGAFFVDGVRIENNQGVNDYWERGFTVVRGTRQHDYGSYSNAESAFLDEGAHSYGLNLSLASYAGAAILLRSKESGDASPQGTIAWRNRDTGMLNPVIYGGGQNLFLAAPGTYFNGGAYPQTDSTFPLGDATHRWSGLWASSATIQTSDASTKVDITDLSAEAALALLAALKPVSYRDAATSDLVDGEVEQSRQAVDADGELAWDNVPVIDERGQPVTETLKRQSVTVVDARGRPVDVPVTVPMTRRVPRMETVKVAAQVPRTRPGRRLHLGFTAQNVRQGIEASPFDDLALHVDPRASDPASTAPEGYRPTELLPVLAAVILDQQRRIEALEARLA